MGVFAESGEYKIDRKPKMHKVILYGAIFFMIIVFLISDL